MSATSTHSLPRKSSKKANFSSQSHRPPVEPGIRQPCKEFYLTEGDIHRLPREVANPFFEEKLAQHKFRDPYFRREKFELPDEFWKLVITAFGLINGRPCWAGTRKLGERSRMAVGTATKYKLLAEYFGLFDVETRPGKGAAHLTDLIRAGDCELADRLLYNHLRPRTDFNSRSNSSHQPCSDKRQSSNQDTREAKATDPETDPEIHETKQQSPNKAQLFDNVYSENAAETPIKTPVFEPDVQQVQAFRQTLANWFGVAVSFQTTLWLLCFVTVRRWNIRAFFRDIDQRHTPRRFDSQDAAWRFMAADYLSRGPTLESYPPRKRDAQTVAPSRDHGDTLARGSPRTPVSADQQSAISTQREHSPPEATQPDPCVHCRGSGIIVVDERKRWCGCDRGAELRYLYGASRDRNRSSASSDAASSNRASAEQSADSLSAFSSRSDGGGVGGEPADR